MNGIDFLKQYGKEETSKQLEKELEKPDLKEGQYFQIDFSDDNRFFATSICQERAHVAYVDQQLDLADFDFDYPIEKKGEKKIKQIDNPYINSISELCQRILSQENCGMDILKCSTAQNILTDLDLMKAFTAIKKKEFWQIRIAQEECDDKCNPDDCVYAHSEEGGCFTNDHLWQSHVTVSGTPVPNDQYYIVVDYANRKEFFLYKVWL